MRLPRMSTRQTMVGILLMAVMLGWVVNRTRYRQRRAQEHMRQLRSLIYPVDSSTGQPYGSMDPAKVRMNARQIDFHQAMAKKWETGARFFWLPITPDPRRP